jgi:methyl-accepting chemotaxis protein
MRNLGLFGKMAIPIVTLTLLIMLILVAFIPKQMSATVIEGAIKNSQSTLGQLKKLREYYTENNSLISEWLTSNTSNNTKTQANLNSLNSSPHDVSGVMADKGLMINLYSPYSFSTQPSLSSQTNRRLTAVEQQTWDALITNPDQAIVQEFTEGERTFVRVAVSDRMVAQSCVSCHNNHPHSPKNDWKIGDIRGVLEITTDITDKLSDGRASSFKITGLATSLLMVMLLALWLVYQNVIQRRMQILNAAMNDIAHGDGDLTVRLDESGNDEITFLSKTFNHFTSHIRDMVEQMATTSQSLSDTSDTMLQIATENSQRLSRQTQETSQAAIAINEMATTVADVASHAIQAAQSAQTAHQVALEGHKVVDATRNDIAGLSRDINNAMGAVHKLEEQSENITGMINVIQSIAEQTNLLALNAAIEAARAGEQGRGFAVVADEVRNLAGRTQKATEEIQKVITALQEDTNSSAHLMKQSCTQAEHTVKQAEEANGALNDISSAVSQITAMNDQIANTSEEQSTVATAIEQNIMAINAMSDESTYASEQSADNSARLSQLASELNALVARFKY